MTSLGATITTTAASSTLTASDPSTSFPGHFVNTSASGGPYGLAQGLQVDATSGNAGAAGGGTWVNLATTRPRS